ncbi:hypothetical protein [Clostridium sp. C2-6-12]|uniref:hypothetical protein n=1 Tax=Clostridium sp. C2-6-12 TaxID=2698832 RepID=UPI001FAE3109|nr:hypothetical protein [Clostridium sp. C2-6-12]
MMRNNIEMGSLYNFDKDRYDLDTKEEAILNKFMREINIKIKKDKRDSLDEKGIFSEDFNKVIGDSALEYHKEADKLILKTQKDNETIRNRKITYSYKKDKIILIPTYMFEDTND